MTLAATMLCVLITLQAAPADELVVDSEDGDFVGGGAAFNYTDVTGSFTSSRNASNGITIDYLGLDATVATVELAGPNMAALAVGSYVDAVKFQSGVNLPSPSLRVQPGTGLECAELSGSFEILELTYLPDTNVDSLAVDIEQFCSSSLRKLTAQLRINSTVPTGPVGLVADAGVDQIVSPSAVVTLDGSLSFATDAAPFTYSWQQLSGIAVTLDDSSAEMPSFTAPVTANREYEFLRFELTITDAMLRESTDEVIVTVSESLAQTTVYRIDAQGFLGLNFDNTITDIPANSFTFIRLADNGIRLDLIENVGAGAGEISSLVEMSGPSGAELNADNYEYALHNSAKPIALPGLSFVYDSLDAPASLGRFTILEVAYLENGAVDRLAVNFEINDTDPADIALGYLRYNSVVPLVSRAPIATAGHDRIFLANEALAQLDGSRTVDQDIGTLVYAWSQTAGPVIALTDADTATPSFIPPQGLLLGEGVFAFELTATNENGFTDTDSVAVTVLGPDDPKTYMHLFGSLANGGVPNPAAVTLVKPDENEISLLELNSGNSTFDNGVSLDAQGVIDFNVVIGDRDGSLLTVGSYSDTSSLASATDPVLSASSAAFSCDAGGAFRLRELVRNGGSGEIESLAVDFFQNCPVDPSYGAIRINSLVPFDLTQPTAIPGPDAGAVQGQTVTLDGSFSWDIDGTIDTYQWVQISGPPIAITGPNLSSASITIPPDLVAATALEFELTVTDNDGNTHSDSVVINVFAAGAALSGLLLFGDEGDSGFSGPDEYLFAGAGVVFSIQTDTPDQIIVEAGPYDFEMMARTGGLLTEENFENALSIDSAIGLFPGILLRNLPNCVNPSGRFVILELVRDGMSQIQNLAVDFALDCDDDGDGFYGALRFNSVIPFRNPIPNAAAGDDIIASEDELIILDAALSSDPDSDVFSASWSQVSGPAVILNPVDALRSAFQVPLMSAGNSIVLELTVQDGDGNLDTDEITVEVRQFRTRASIVRKDVNTGAEFVDLSENRMTFTIDRVGLVDEFEFTGKDEYQLALQLNDDPFLSPGFYPIDNRLVADAGTIRLLIAGPDADYQEAFQCEANDGVDELDTEGWVEIKEVQYDVGNIVDNISFDFQVFCNDNSFWGSVQIDSDIYKSVAVPIADAGNQVFIRPGTDVTLSAAQTVVPLGATATYQWRQLSGEPAVILDADEIVATLKVPRVGASHNPVIKIELLVIGASGFSDRDVLELFLVVRDEDDDSAQRDDEQSSGGSSSSATSFPGLLIALMGLLQVMAWYRRKYRAQ